ncbi:MAG: hypothetical protein LC664_08095 [Flavobacteriales bacterium]|nr:hypothetical protein [Flavobacteriales bacterium]
MIDLGQEFFENRHFFGGLSVHQIILNPPAEGYPPVFLLCREKKAGRYCEYAVGLRLTQLNKLLMKGVSSKSRMAVCERLSELLVPEEQVSKNFRLREVLGTPLRINGISVYAEVRQYITEPPGESAPMYFFEILENQ